MRETLLTTMLATTLTMSAQEQAPMLLQYDRPADFFEETEIDENELDMSERELKVKKKAD